MRRMMDLARRVAERVDVGTRIAWEQIISSPAFLSLATSVARSLPIRDRRGLPSDSIMAQQTDDYRRVNGGKRRATVGTAAMMCLVAATSSAFGQKIDGRVQLPDSSPATQLTVSMVDSAGKTLSRVVTNDAGRYTIGWLPGARHL